MVLKDSTQSPEGILAISGFFGRLRKYRSPFELVGMDHPAHDLNTDAYRRISPFEQIPVIDDDGVVL